MKQSIALILKITFLSSLITILTLLAPVRSANAIGIEMLQGKPLPVAAKSVLLAEGIKLVTQGGADLIAAHTENAWTWDYAYALPKKDQKNDTTLFGDPNIAYALASADGWFGRHALAEGLANKQTGVIITYAETNKLAVAKAIAGIGKDYQTAGARAAALILAKIVQIAVDPLPGPEVIDTVNNFSPAGFQYDIGLVDPYGEERTLLSINGHMFFNLATNDWDLEINDPMNNLSTGNFERTVDASGAVTYTLLSPVDYAIPFAVPDSWLPDSYFSILTKGGVIAQSVPEPATMLLFGIGMAGLIGGGMVRRRK